MVPIAETHAMIRGLVDKAKGPTGVDTTDLKKLAGNLNARTVDELAQLRSAVGVRAGGLKVEQINTMIDRAVGAHIQGYVLVTSGSGKVKPERVPVARKPKSTREQITAEDPKRPDGTPIRPIKGVA